MGGYWRLFSRMLTLSDVYVVEIAVENRLAGGKEQNKRVKRKTCGQLLEQVRNKMMAA